MIKPETYVKILHICLQQFMPAIHNVLTENAVLGSLYLVITSIELFWA